MNSLQFSGKIVLHLLSIEILGSFWDGIWSFGMDPKLRPPQIPTLHPSQFFWHIKPFVPEWKYFIDFVKMCKVRKWNFSPNFELCTFKLGYYSFSIIYGLLLMFKREIMIRLVPLWKSFLPVVIYIWSKFKTPYSWIIFCQYKEVFSQKYFLWTHASVCLCFDNWQCDKTSQNCPFLNFLFWKTERERKY